MKITKIINGERRIVEVSEQAYWCFYKRQGYEPFVPEEPKQEEPKNPPTADDLFVDAVKSKPISQWSNKELKRYAELKGMNPKSDDLRETIKEAIEDGHDTETENRTP